MSGLADDAHIVAPRASGVLVALLSACSFALSGPLARGLLDDGWTPGAVVVLRIGLGALVLTPFGLRALRGHAAVVRRNVWLIGLYGVCGVAVAQFCYFAAIEHMQVGAALLIEYAAPVVVVGWMWLRHGHRPARVTIVGAVLAIAGLVLVLDLLGGVDVSTIGALWALAAMVGVSAYFIINGDDTTGLPPLGLAWLGLVVGVVLLGALSATGLLPFDAAAVHVDLAGMAAPWWTPILLLGTVTAALSYATGIVAGRRLGARLASFMGLVEVLAAVLFAWALLGELPRAVQLLGGLFVLAGVVVVRLGEGEIVADERRQPVAAESLPGA